MPEEEKTVKLIYEIEFVSPENFEPQNWLCAGNLKLLINEHYKVNKMNSPFRKIRMIEPKEMISQSEKVDYYNLAFLDGYRTAEVEIKEGLKGGNPKFPEPENETQEQILEVYQEIFDMLRELIEQSAELSFDKNKKYGNSATEPIKVFSLLDATNSILIRMDDKLSRIIESSNLTKLQNMRYKCCDSFFSEEAIFKQFFNRILYSNKDLRENDVKDLFGYMMLLCLAKGWTKSAHLKD